MPRVHAMIDEAEGKGDRAMVADLKRQLAEAKAALEPSDETIRTLIDRLWQEVKQSSGWQPDWAEIIRAAFRCARNEAKTDNSDGDKQLKVRLPTPKSEPNLRSSYIFPSER